jgi:hypothetical protein
VATSVTRLRSVSATSSNQNAWPEVVSDESLRPRSGFAVESASLTRARATTTDHPC